MNRPLALVVCSLAALGAGALVLDEPPIVKPGATASDAPSDAVVLFDGTSLKGWKNSNGGGAAAWIPDEKSGGAMTASPGKGSIISDFTFNDAQIHVEFATPAEVHGDSQDRGNSGVYIQGRYELQVLDSFNNSTYSDGQCGAIYGQHAPLANACRGPGEWQTYDIIFTAPKFNEKGEKIANARITAIHNGVLVQNNMEITGPTGGSLSKETAAPGPLYLQEHGNTVKFRNVWIRPLGTSQSKN